MGSAGSRAGKQAPGLAQEGAGPWAGHRREGWARESPQHAWQLPTCLCSWLLGKADSHGLGKLQVLLPHSVGTLKDRPELPLLRVSVPPSPPPLLVISLWLVPVPGDPQKVPLGWWGHPREELRALGHPCFLPPSHLGWHISLDGPFSVPQAQLCPALVHCRGLSRPWTLLGLDPAFTSPQPSSRLFAQSFHGH